MIPSDVASRMQVSADATLRPVAPAQEISDKLSGLTAGQKVMAEVQALLPNGTYRAMINQRNITLALPFSAKSGDSLELLVTESDGKLTLAVVAHQSGEGGKTSQESVTATLSRTGQLIGTLFSDKNSGEKVALPLNGNQPLATAPPTQGQDLLPLLKQAIAQSGMFYEAHQAEWVAGRFSQTELLNEPQGRLSTPRETAGHSAMPMAQTAAADSAQQANPLRGTTPEQDGNSAGSSKALLSQSAQSSGQVIAQPLQALVQQQLEALATQNYSWQGQIWPGQQMHWEIDEDGRQKTADGEESESRWSTRLRMTLPHLGEIDAGIRLQGGQVTLNLHAVDAATRDLMQSKGGDLRQQFDAAGLILAGMGFITGKHSEANDVPDGN